MTLGATAPVETLPVLGRWRSAQSPPAIGPEAVAEALGRVREPFYLLRVGDAFAVGRGGAASLDDHAADGEYPLLARVPACPPESLGDLAFCRDLGIRYPYIAGAMANGVGSVEIVVAMARAGMIGFFGAAGLPLARVEADIDRIQNELRTPDGGCLPYGSNLIHSPNEPNLEAGVVDLYLRKGVRLVSASAYLRLSLPLIRYRVHGIHRNERGEVVAPNRVIAKVSRVEVAERFFSPPPEKYLRQLVESGDITEEQAALAAEIPVAQDLTAEADSGGHTDNQPFIALLPTMLALADRMREQHGFPFRLRVGAAGGIGTPAAACAAFAMGAAYILTGSINQSCVEAGTSPVVRDLLVKTRQADVAMAPAADMFEMGVKVQVLKRGTMFAMRAGKLYEHYRAFTSLDEIPPATRAQLEKDFFKAPVDEVWRQTRDFFTERDPAQLDRAERDPKHKMALVFRWYLGQSSHWANVGQPDRLMDYQIWCGPAMGAFNEWARGSFLESVEDRRVETLALNLLHGAAVQTRVANLRSQGLAAAAEGVKIVPQRLSRLKELLN
jgi:trans-AT polyketide synthase, acyltransferase and oxidoreductase domains